VSPIWFHIILAAVGFAVLVAVAVVWFYLRSGGGDQED
jgi:hypothetical protein